MNELFVIPRDANVIRDWTEDFATRFGVLPIAGGETPGAVATPPAPALEPAQAPPAQPAAPAATQAPAAPQAQPGEPGQADPAAAQMEPTPDWAQKLIEGMDRLAPPAQVDPLAVELGFGPAPAQPFPGQQPVTQPAQQQPAAGQQFAGGVPQLAGQPGGPAAPQPGVPAGIPGQPDPTEQLVNQLIDERARGVVNGVLEQQLVPYLQQQEQAREAGEFQALREDYPKMQDPAFASEVVSLARQWARETLGDERFASKPGYLETVLLAKMARDAQQQTAQPGGQQQQPGNGSQVPIEGGGGSNPTPAVQQSTQLAQEIVDAKPGGGLNSLWV